MKVLILEPYYGGSHKSFLDGLVAHISAKIDLLTLPARKWKWRMRLAAPYFAEMLQNRSGDYESVLCSTFVDVAAFKALAPSWVQGVPVITYFHENQFVYPVQAKDERDFHFALTNYTTALASEKILFNSRYNLDSFLEGCRSLTLQAPDMKADYGLEAIRRKAIVIPPGIDFSAIDNAPDPNPNPKEKQSGPVSGPVVLWNHRWEHDKNPEAFFETLFEMDRQGVDFGLIVLGQSFQYRPGIFEVARKRLSRRIVHFGTVDSRRAYAAGLRKGDIAVSTATHEFFGIAVIEAVRAGCRPLLPNRLSYPEIFPEDFLYEDGELLDRLMNRLEIQRLSNEEALSLTNRFSWDSLAPEYEAVLTGK
jgi:glycosyltransferase involved in cell wall biosynthesis